MKSLALMEKRSSVAARRDAGWTSGMRTGRSWLVTDLWLEKVLIKGWRTNSLALLELEGVSDV
jgi:hypothetical protein